MLDIGGGRSSLGSALADRGAEVDVLDISETALAQTVAANSRIHAIVADIREWTPEHSYDAVHDRAVLHFLVDPRDRNRYAVTVTAATAPGGPFRDRHLRYRRTVAVLGTASAAQQFR